jgi:PAS domain S-box-containing protein
MNSKTQSFNQDSAVAQDMSEESLRLLFDNIQVGVYIVQDGKFVYVNPRFAADMGFIEDELVGKVSLNFVHPEDREKLREETIKRLKGELSSPYDFRVVTKNGKTRTVIETMTSIQYKGKRAALGSHIDETERKLMQEALQESEEKYRMLVEDALIGIMNVDITGKITYVNKTILEATGYSWDEIVGKNAFSLGLVSSEMVKTLKKKLKEKLLGQPPGLMEIQYKRKDGKWIWLQIRGRVRWKGPVPVGIQIIGDDITKRKQAEEMLQASRESFHNIVERSTDGIVVTNRDGVVLFANKILYTILGRKSEDMIGKMFGLPIVVGEVSEVDIIRPGGEPGVAEMGVVNTEWEGEPAYLISLHDITERKQFEKKLREIDRMRMEFISNVSHELRTPLQVIIGYCNLLLREQVLDIQDQKEFLNIINRYGELLSKLVNNLLEVSRLESSRFTIHKQKQPVREILQQAIDGFQGIANDKDIVIKGNLSEELPHLDIDGERLSQVMFNLLSNAIKFSPKSGDIIVNAKVYNKELLVSVADHGVGIPKEAIPQLFNRFYRAGNLDSAGGAGLGLYVSKQIIEAHGGRIWAESDVDAGSTFSFALPLVQVTEDTSKKKILVIEDDPVTANFLKYTLEPEGYDISTVQDGQEGLEKVQIEMPDLIILDIMLPGINGFEICRRLRAEPNTASLPILVFSAKAHEIDKATGLRVGADDYISKPVIPEVIIEHVKNLLVKEKSED